MSNESKKIISISLFFLVFGGISALFKLWGAVFEFSWGFFPIFGKAVLENYFTSPQFWTSIVIAVLSIAGIVISARFRKKIYVVISIVIEVISLASILVNVSIK